MCKEDCRVTTAPSNRDWAFFRLKDSQILANLLDVCAKESVDYTEDGMEAIIFTAQVRDLIFIDDVTMSNFHQIMS